MTEALAEPPPRFFVVSFTTDSLQSAEPLPGTVERQPLGGTNLDCVPEPYCSI